MVLFRYFLLWLDLVWMFTQMSPSDNFTIKYSRCIIVSLELSVCTYTRGIFIHYKCEYPVGAALSSDYGVFSTIPFVFFKTQIDLMLLWGIKRSYLWKCITQSWQKRTIKWKNLYIDTYIKYCNCSQWSNQSIRLTCVQRSSDALANSNKSVKNWRILVELWMWRGVGHVELSACAEAVAVV